MNPLAVPQPGFPRLGLAAGHPQAIDLNQPGSFIHWSIFYVSVANLVLIAVMVAIFGAALLLRFPGGHSRAGAAAPGDPAAGDAGIAQAPPPDDEDARMWTARLRRRAVSALPPGKLLPDRQPAYVASWIYVFAVGSLAALAAAIGSGLALALGGPDWWHSNPAGHFETGSYPGQPWLWLYTLWYQIPRFSTSANVDMIAVYLTGIATLLLLLVPFIPGLRDIPGSSRYTA
jgi:hypothetical protein